MQKKVNGHLYVFDLTPFEITENTDASVIFVQNECVDGYKELNVSLANKIKGFNQFLLCVQKQEWSMPADPVDGGLEWSASTATVRIGDTNSYPTLINPNELEVTYSSSNESVATIDSTGAITLVGAGSSNITVESAAEPGFTADSASYTLTVLAALVSPELAWSANSATVTVDGNDNVFPTLTNPHSVTVVYTSSDSTAATINQSNGAITLVGAGSTTITAAYVGGDTYYAQSVSYTLTVEAAQDPVQPGETEYLSPRITGVNNDVNNFNIGAILNVKDNTALVNAIEFTGHAEQGSTSSLEVDVDYAMGTPFSFKFDENDPVEYFSLCYAPTNDGHKFTVYLSDVANDKGSGNYYTIDSSDFSVEDDHTYRIGLTIDVSDAQTNSVVHVYPTFAIDGMTCSPRDDQGEVLETPQSLDFDISQGTQGLENWINNFQANVYLFGCDNGANWGEFTTTTLPFELSTVKVEYSTGADLSQLQVGTEATPWILTATSPNTFDDGIDDWSLSPMSSLVEGGGDSGDTLYTLTVNCDSTFASLAAGGQFGVVGRCTADNKPALEGDTGYYTKVFIYDEQNPEQVIGFVVNDMPEGCQFQFDERNFPVGFNLTSSPVLENGTDGLADLGQTYVMPASDVTVTLTAQEDVPQ